MDYTPPRPLAHSPGARPPPGRPPERGGGIARQRHWIFSPGALFLCASCSLGIVRTDLSSLFAARIPTIWPRTGKCHTPWRLLLGVPKCHAFYIAVTMGLSEYECE